MKKVLSAFGVLGAALVLLGAPVSAQNPAAITATIAANPTNPAAGTTVTVTGTFAIPALSTTAAEVSISVSGGAAPSVVSSSAGLTSCITSATAVTCTWAVQDPAAPQSLVISVPVSGSGTVTFNANAGVPGQATSRANTSIVVGGTTTTSSTTTSSTTTTAATTTAATTTAATTTLAPITIAETTTTAAGTLPATGSNSQAPLVVAIVAIALGALLVGGARLLRSRS